MSDTLWVVRLANGGAVTTTDEDRAWEIHRRKEDSALYRRPFVEIRLPFIDKGDYEFSIGTSQEDVCTHLPTGVRGFGDDRREAYKFMLRSLYAHLERKDEVLVSGN